MRRKGWIDFLAVPASGRCNLVWDVRSDGRAGGDQKVSSADFDEHGGHSARQYRVQPADHGRTSLARAKAFELNELKRAYSKAVAGDDDILTQFVEAADLQNRISAAQSFNELVSVYRWMEDGHGDEFADLGRH